MLCALVLPGKGRRRAARPADPHIAMLRSVEALVTDFAHCPAEERTTLHCFLTTGGRICWTCRTYTPNHLPTTSQGGPMTDLPHTEYMAAVADELAVYRAAPGNWWAETPDDQQLDGVFTNFPDSSVDSGQWPHGVYLGWDQNQGWLLIEQGGGRNATPLDPDGVSTYSSPRQVACSASNALLGRSTGPICNDGSWSWDSRPLEAAIEAWENS